MANIERLQQARKIIDAAPEDRLRMAVLSQASGCDTTYCFAGWLIASPWFRDHTELGQFELTARGRILYIRNCEYHSPFNAVAAVLAINADDADALMGLSCRFDNMAKQPDKACVIANINRIIAGLPAIPYDINNQE